MNSRIRRALCIPLNPDYVAARSLRSLRSNYNYSLLIETCHCLKWNFEKNTYLQYID